MINTFVKIISSAVVCDKELEMGDDLSSVIMGTVIKITDEDQNDGSINRTYHIKG